MSAVDMVLRVLAVAFGASLVVIALGSAIKTVVLPRASVSFVTRWVFLNVQHVFRVLARPSLSLAKRDRRLAWYSPLGLIATLVAWLTLTLVGFMFVFWGVEHVSMRSAFVESGSALLTLGLTRPGSLPGATIAFIAAGIGLFLLALLITYLPSIYAAFSRRELGVTALEVNRTEGSEVLLASDVEEARERLAVSGTHVLALVDLAAVVRERFEGLARVAGI